MLSKFLEKSVQKAPIFPIKASFERGLIWKRLFDILFSGCVIICLFPLYCLISLLVWIYSRASPIYAQKRVGRGGRHFNCYKFRTMVLDADLMLEKILKENESLRIEWFETRKLKRDPRITKIGHFLRRTSLDELPQFFNVFIGDLSVVGPRAVVQEEIDTHFKEEAEVIFKVRPGITGLWQISGRSDVSYLKRIELDRIYVDRISLKQDMKIVVKTIPLLFNTKGAY